MQSQSEQKLIKILDSLPLFAKNFLIIHDKLGVERKFVFNKAQIYVDQRLDLQFKETGKVRALILKGRQQGISTYVQARYFRKIVTKKGKKAFILTHLSDATRSIFEMTKRYSENLDPDFFTQPDKKNDNQLTYSKLGSGYRVGTAGNENIGRSMTNQYLHLSEYAFYDKAESINMGLMQTVAEMGGTEIIKESTANGIDNSFYREWQEAQNGNSSYQVIFVPWYWQDEYCITPDVSFVLSDEESEYYYRFKEDGLNLGHLNWRRIKLQDFEGNYEQKCRRFRQEYPFTPIEAFLNSVTKTYIQSEEVLRARKNKVESNSRLIIGVDPARDGDDRTAIIRRRGRCAYGLETYHNIDTMELAGILRRIIEKENPSKVNIDVIGIGAGVVDRLNELGHEDIVQPINVTRTSTDPDRFRNLRAELWCNMREWFIGEMQVQIPDSDELQTDLTGLGYKYDSSDKLQIERKDEAKKRGLLSPDTADALSFTFVDGQYLSSGYSTNIIDPKTRGMFT